MIEHKFERGACFKCIHRRTIPGYSHTRCAHPKVVEIEPSGNMFTVMAAMWNPKMAIVMVDLGIKGNKHGIQNGWFMWPANFDPCWLDNCNGYTPEEKPDDDDSTGGA